jgi:hypothetical protein
MTYSSSGGEPASRFFAVEQELLKAFNELITLRKVSPRLSQSLVVCTDSGVGRAFTTLLGAGRQFEARSYMVGKPL